ncbi:outer membrane usher protein [Escherichia sp. KTE114]|nr:outer membrane usher protein [Escherichia sp. KTE114]
MMIRCKLKHIALCCISAFSGFAVAAESIEYDANFLMGSSAAGIDLSRYSEGNPVLPGKYNARVYVNDISASSMEIEFIDTGSKVASACISHKMLARLHIKQPELKDNEGILQKRENPEDDCLNLSVAIPQAHEYFDVGEQQFNLTIPQAWLITNYQGYVDPSLWEDGVTAAMLSYRLNGWENSYHGDDNQSFYAALNAGINLGNWRLRTNGNYSWTNDGESRFDFQNRYLQRDISAIRSQLILGETYTTGETFDSVSIKGVRLYSDDRMLPPSLNGFSPVIRGVANSNAKITVTQGSYKIYESTVPAGAFVIDALSPAGYGNDLVVTIEEADGSKRTFTQPFSSVAQMLRPGVGRWDISGGQVDNDSLRDDYNLLQGSFYYGLNNYFTGYTGIQITDSDYLALLLGVGVNTSMGAFSFDVTQSKAIVENDNTYTGQSYRISWNKLFTPTNTSLNLAAYRYSTSDYLGLNDALTLQDNAKYLDKGDDSTMETYSRLRNQFTVSLNQPLKVGEEDYGSFYLNGSWMDYWGGRGSRSNYGMGYSKGHSWGSWSVSVQRTWDENNRKDDSMYLSITLPIETLLGGKRRESGFRYIDSRVSSDFNGNHTMNISSNGSNENYSYSLNTGYNMNKRSADLSTIGGYFSYDSPWGTISSSASATSDNSRQLSLSTDGGFVLHRGGLTFSNDSFNDSDTLVLVKAPGAKGARINGGQNTVDHWGYGITSSASAYRENEVSLDIEGLENDVELKSTSVKTVPRSGAVILTSFETDQGRSALIHMRRSDGNILPFAADVTDETGNVLGSVGQGNQVFVRGIAEKGELNIRWVDVKTQQPQSCKAFYQAPLVEEDGKRTVVLDNVMCTVSGAH